MNRVGVIARGQTGIRGDRERGKAMRAVFIGFRQKVRKGARGSPLNDLKLHKRVTYLYKDSTRGLFSVSLVVKTIHVIGLSH
jgi:hypothetical protein